MYVHIAVFKWKSTASLKDIEIALLDIQNLSTEIPGIVEICRQKRLQVRRGLLARRVGAR